MQGNNANQVMKTVFKKNVGQSYIQIEYNKSNKKDEERQNQEQQQEIEQTVDANSVILSKKYLDNKGMVTLKKQGSLFLEKETGGGFFSCFQTARRVEMAVLENRILIVRGQNGKVKQSVNFDTTTVAMNCTDKCLKITIQSQDKSKQKQLYFQTNKNQNIRQWEAIFKQAISGSLGEQFKLNYITTIPNYWQNQSIPAMEFSKNCNSGDIILFKSTHKLASFQRGLTGSQYDHIALVLRNSKDQLLLFQSNSDSGVAITFWKDMIRFKWFEAAEKIAYRQLKNVKRDDVFLGILEGFVAQNLDKKFKIGIGKLFKFTSKFESKQNQKDRTYFCSQLVAKCYKQLGLLQPQKSSTQYWPGCFSQLKTLPLLKGAELGPEQIICFDKQLCKKR